MAKLPLFDVGQQSFTQSEQIGTEEFEPKYPECQDSQLSYLHILYERISRICAYT